MQEIYILKGYVKFLQGVNRMFRKLVSLLISAVLLILPVTNLLAASMNVTQVAVPAPVEKLGKNDINENNVAISRDKARNIAVKSLKDLLEIEVDDKKFESRIMLRQNYGIKQNYVWEINYNFYNNVKSLNYLVVINADTGKVFQIQTNEYTNNGEQTALSKITEDEAKAIAESFLKRVNPKEISNLKYISNPNQFYYESGRYPVNYEFRFIRVVNDIEFESNSINVSVNGATGKVTGYNYNWDEDINLPSAEGLISKEKATELIKQGTDLKLHYTSHRNKYDYNEKISEIKLIYSPDYPNGPFIDAKDGKPLNWNYSSTEQLGIKDITKDQKEK
ncbi:MAG: hypothetical protein K0R31_2475, partial [Clostridiales bacterium]|nr:hypothetical protein [Clostridiales bacterium]